MKNQYNLLLDCILFISLSFYSLQTVFASSMAVDSLELPIAGFQTSDTLFYNLLGAKVLEQSFFNSSDELEKVVELESINSGIYVLQLQSEKRLIESPKIWVK